MVLKKQKIKLKLKLITLLLLCLGLTNFKCEQSNIREHNDFKFLYIAVVYCAQAYLREEKE